MLKVILHIPHSSLKIPKFFWDNSFLLHKTEIKKFTKNFKDLQKNILNLLLQIQNLKIE